MSSPPPYSTSPPFYRSTLPDGGLPIASDLSTQSTSESKLPPMGPSSGSLITPRRSENPTFQQSQPQTHQQTQEGDGSAANSATINCWLKIEDYATQIRIVALQARCGATISPEQVQRAHELAVRMQDEIQPLLNNSHTGNGGASQFISPIPQLRALSGSSPSPARSPMLIANKMAFPGVPPLGQAGQSGVSPNGSFGHSSGYGSPSLGPPLDGASPMFSYTPPADHVKPKARTKRKRSDESYRVCRTCLTTETPEWRRGPNGPRTLCNACGLKWAKKQRALKREESPLPPPKHESHPDLSGVVDDKDDK